MDEAALIQDLDDPANLEILRRMIKKKPFLRNIYGDFYQELLADIPAGARIVELGSGAGFIKKFRPDAVVSDILLYKNLDLVFSGTRIPFKSSSVDAFAMIDVLHHVKDPEAFLHEMGRALKIGGQIAMIEPANTAWARFVYTKFHHEGFDPSADWSIPDGGALSQANMALPWIIFSRDRASFAGKFPYFRVSYERRHTPIRYLASGGLTLRQLLPTSLYPAAVFFEKLLSPFSDILGMFMTVKLEKVSRNDV